MSPFGPLTSYDLPGRPIYEPDQHSNYAFDEYFFGVPERSFATTKPRKITAYRDAPFDTDKFIGIFPEFDNETTWPRKLIEGSAKRAWFYVTKYAQCDYLDGDDREYAHHLMTAHIMIITRRNNAVMQNAGAGIPSQPGAGGMSGGMVASGQLGTTGIVTNASVGGVSVGLSLPNHATFWEFWMSQTPYGIELLSFLSSHVPVGIYSEGDDLRMCLRD